MLKAGALKACHWLVCGCSEDACLAADATPDGLQIACNIGPKLCGLAPTANKSMIEFRASLLMSSPDMSAS